jgi:hypothetical protein
VITETKFEEVTIIRGGFKPGDVFVRELPVQMSMEPQFIVRREVPAAPEFEHASGTPGTAVLGGDPEPVWYIRSEVAPGEFEEEWVDAQGHYHPDSEVSFFVPSVVLDPEDARKKIYEAIRISRAFHGAQTEAQYQDNIVQTVMSALGIEVK